MAQTLVQWGPEYIDEDEHTKRLAIGWVNPTPKPKVEESAPLGVDLLLKEVPARKLKADVMQAYQNLGGAAWLEKLGKQDPSLLAKFVMKILPQSIESDVRLEAHISSDVTAMTTQELKLMIMKRLSESAVPVEDDSNAEK